MSCTVPRETRGEVHLSDSETLRLGDAMSCWGSAAGWGWSLVGTHTHTHGDTRDALGHGTHTHTPRTQETGRRRDTTGHTPRRGAARCRCGLTGHGSARGWRRSELTNERKYRHDALWSASPLSHTFMHTFKRKSSIRDPYICACGCPAQQHRHVLHGVANAF